MAEDISFDKDAKNLKPLYIIGAEQNFKKWTMPLKMLTVMLPPSEPPWAPACTQYTEIHAYKNNF